MIKGALKRLLRYLGSFLCVSAKEFTVLRKLTHGRLKICVCVCVCVYMICYKIMATTAQTIWKKKRK